MEIMNNVKHMGESRRRIESKVKTYEREKKKKRRMRDGKREMSERAGE